MVSKQTKKELKAGYLYMTIVFIWGLFIMFLLNGVIYTFSGVTWFWHLSWNLVPIVVLGLVFLYDTNNIVEHNVNPKAKKVWEELGEDKVTVINTMKPFNNYTISKVG